MKYKKSIKHRKYFKDCLRQPRIADAAQERAIQLRQQAVEEFTAASLAGQPFAATLSELKQGARPGSVPSSLPGHFSMPQTGKWPLLWVINCL